MLKRCLNGLILDRKLRLFTMHFSVCSCFCAEEALYTDMLSTYPIKRHFFVFVLTVTCIASYLSFKKESTDQKWKSFYQFLPNVRLNSSGDLSLNEKLAPQNLWPPNKVNDYKKVDLFILGLFELSTKFGAKPESRTEVEAAKLAINHVNTRNILPYYRLNLLINDTKCDPGVGIDRFFHALYSNRTIIMLLGSGCSNVTESLANIVPYWNIIQVSYGSTSPALSDRSKFPLFFRTIAPESTRNAARVAFVNHFGWRTVTTFTQSENYFLLPANRLIASLERSNVSCFAVITFSVDNYKEQLRDLKDRDTRIIIGSFSETVAPKIFCEIYQLKMYGEDYVWILGDLRGSLRNFHDCPIIHTRRSTDGVILISNHNALPGSSESISGLTNESFERKLREANVSMSILAKETYDAIWAMSLTLKRVQEMNFNLSFSHFTYQRRDLLELFLSKMSALKFMGISGPVQFDGADRIGNAVLRQLQAGKLEKIAVYDSRSDRLDFKCEGCKEIKFAGNRVPVAQRILKTHLITVPKTAFYLVLFFSLTGICVCAICLYFNVRFRHIKTVKLSSPRLNNIVVFGCFLVYTAVILLGLDGSIITSDLHFSRVCAARVYLLSAGFSLAFGAIFAKTYRVHRIFTYSGTSLVKDKSLKDKQLIAAILVLLLIDGVVVVFWTAVDPMERRINNLSLVVSEVEQGVVYQPQVEVCRSNSTIGWFTAIYGYKAFLLIMGVYMAWETRHVKVQILNDSQYISICVYCAVSSSIVVFISNILSNHVVLSYLATTLSILISTTVTLILLFVPKMRAVLRRIDVEEDPVVQSMGLRVECNTRRLVVNDTRELLYRMEVQNKVYKAEIAELDREIARLEELLMSSGSNSVFVISSNDLDLERVSVPSGSNRASWPNCVTTTPGRFLSERRLAKSSTETLLKKLRRIFGSDLRPEKNGDDSGKKSPVIRDGGAAIGDSGSAALSANELTFT